GQTCRTVWREEGDGEIGRWDFETLAYELLPFSPEELQARRALREARGIAPAPAADHRANLWTARQLWWNRLEDERKLIAMRGWQEGGVPQGYRNNFLFVAACAVCWGL